MAKNTKTPAMVLQELSVKKGFAPPTYEIIYSISGTHNNRFDYQVTVAGITAHGTGSSKQVSKHNAAHNALLKLEDLKIYFPEQNPTQAFKMPKSEPDSPFKSAPNCIGPLKDLCVEHKIPDPIFTQVSEVGPPHSKEFTFECSVASIKTIATGNTKKMAKQLAAKEMLDRLTEVMPEIAAEYETNNLAITDLDSDAIKYYNEFYGSIIPDKTVKIEDYSYKLKKIMEEKGLTYNDFSKEIQQKTEESLKSLLNKLELSYKFYKIQDDPIMVSLSLNTDTPFTTIGMAKSEEAAHATALFEAFEIIDTFLKV